MGMASGDRKEGVYWMTEFEHFRDNYCGHQSGTLKFDSEEDPVPGCTYKNEVNASCWADWQKCTIENCPFFQKFEIKRRRM